MLNQRRVYGHGKGPRCRGDEDWRGGDSGIDEGGAVTNASVIEMLRVLSSGDEVDLAVEFALDLLRR